MKLTTTEAVYLRGYIKTLRSKTTQEAMKDALDGEQELMCCYASNVKRVSDIVRRIVLSSHHAGLLAKLGEPLDMNNVDTTNDQAIIISSKEDLNTGNRWPIKRTMIDILVASGVKFIGLYLCGEGEDPNNKTYICIIDARPGSKDHQMCLDVANEHNLDVRITSSEWFKETA